MELGTRGGSCCCEDKRDCCGEKRDCCKRRWEFPRPVASKAATFAFENGVGFDGGGLGLAAAFKLREEEGEDEEAGLLSTSSHIPKLRLISLNQSLRNLIKKSMLTFSPLSSAVPDTLENFSLTL